MKNNYLTPRIPLSIVCIGLLAYAISYFQSQKAAQSPSVKEIDTASHQYKIAIFTPASHPSLEQIESGFRDGLIKNKHLRCSFDTYNGNGNPTLMHAQSEEIIDKDYDLIFTIGAKTTQMAKEASQRKNKPTPIVFGVVARPEKINLIASRASSENNLTGLTADPDYECQIKTLHFLNPNIKKILLIYDPTQSSGLESDRMVTEKILNELGISLKVIEIYKSNDVHSKISSQTDDVDAILVFKDNTIVSSIDYIIKHCNRIGIPLCVTELDSVPKGAAIGFSITSYDSGVESADKAYSILVEKKHPSQIPITQAKNFKIMINRKALDSQHLISDPNLNQLILSLEVI